MSTAPQLVIAAGQVELCLVSPVRNLDVIDFLSNRCKWCGEYIFDSSTKPRCFCDNNNRCCNNFSRRGGVTKAVWEATLLARIKTKNVVMDHPAFDMVARSARYEGRTFKDGRKMFRQSASPSSYVRIPKFGGGLQPSGVSVATKRTQANQVDVNDRPKAPEPTPTLTGWEFGEVEHRGRAGIRRIERRNDQEAFAVK